MVTKDKECGGCHKLTKLWQAKRKLPDGTIQPGLCKECANKPKVGIGVKTYSVKVNNSELVPIYKSILKAIQAPKKQKPIPRMSDKEKKRQAQYKLVRKYYLAKEPTCEAMIAGCTRESTQIHHKKGRIGNLLVDMKFFLATCDNCHKWIELNVEQAKELGFSLNRLDK